MREFAATDMIDAFVSAGVNVCFTNPGTSEMHLVLALDKSEQAGKMRSVLCLFEGVVTGAADGYARMTGVPALSLLHLGHGLANGLANLHNAKWARSPVINVVGDHASPLRRFLAHPAETQSSPYLGDIESFASPVSGWTRRCRHVDLAAVDCECWVGLGGVAWLHGRWACCRCAALHAPDMNMHTVVRDALARAQAGLR
jgi:acetolactate synthase-1/2/3 large subunit|eukprot:COSAG01_NODE_1252_length_11052_cov_503.195380_10_plen_200_part_00